MQFLVIQRILGLLMMVFSSTMLPPILAGLIFDQDGAITTLCRGVFSRFWSPGFLLYLPVYRHKKELRFARRLSGGGAFLDRAGPGRWPAHLSVRVSMIFRGPTRCFESMSGITTTGATVIVGLDEFYHIRCCCIARNCNGSAGWVLSYWRLPCCRCLVSVVCSCFAPKPRGPSKTPS